jgi:hypothetical protein
MLVHCADIPTAELADFERAIRANGKDPGAFKAQMFEATLQELGATLRRVHVYTRSAAVQYDASAGSPWTASFAAHLARGLFG